MREIRIDDKWYFKIQDPNTETLEKFEYPFILRYNEKQTLSPNNVEIAMAQRIMKLEDEIKEALK